MWCEMANHLWVPVRCPLARLGTYMTILSCPCIIFGSILLIASHFVLWAVLPFVNLNCLLQSPIPPVESSYKIANTCVHVDRKHDIFQTLFLIPSKEFWGIVSQSTYFNFIKSWCTDFIHVTTKEACYGQFWISGEG